MDWGRKKTEEQKRVAYEKKKRHGIILDEDKSYSSPSEKKFGIMSKLQLKKQNTFDKVKYRVAQWEARGRDTASLTFGASTDKELGTSKVKTGIGKRRIKAGDKTNASIDNLIYETDYDQFVNLEDQTLKKDPRMLARQVASWRLARELNIRVLSREKYALHKLDSGEDELVAISARVTGQSLQDMQADMHRILAGRGDSVAEKQAMIGQQIFSGKIQKELSELQIMDALTGQTDRHSGNIFIDLDTQSVRGIDNDQAFGYENTQVNNHNALGSFRFLDGGAKLEYAQSQIDVQTAEKVLAITDASLEKILTDKAGSTYGEYLTDAEIEAAKVRLAAIQQQIRQLKAQGKLIKTWNETTYQASLAEAQLPIKIGDEAKAASRDTRKYTNYTARSVHKMIG